MLRKDGTRIIVEAHGRPVAPGSARRHTVIRDITAASRPRRRSVRARRRFPELVERSPFGTYVVDSQFRIAMMNAASQEGAFRNVRPSSGAIWPR